MDVSDTHSKSFTRQRYRMTVKPLLMPRFDPGSKINLHVQTLVPTQTPITSNKVLSVL